MLFIAALVSALFFSCIYVVGNSKNICVDNGFVTFAKDAVKIVFYNDKEETIDVKTLLEDLNSHGFENVLIPQKLYNYQASVPVYSEGLNNKSSNQRVEFVLSFDGVAYSFRLEKIDSNVFIGNYFLNSENAKTVIVDDICISVLEYENGKSCIYFAYDKHNYFIQSDILLSEMINTAQTIIKMEG